MPMSSYLAAGVIRLHSFGDSTIASETVGDNPLRVDFSYKNAFLVAFHLI